MAKNRTQVPIYLLKARLISPKIRGEVIQDLVFVRHVSEIVYGSAEHAGTYIPAASLLPVTVTILIRGKPKQENGRLKTVVGIADADGNETRAVFELKGA
jgi:hypothetical protein